MGRLITLEYLERRCAINEEVLHDLGMLIAAYVPAITPHLERIGKDWDKAIDKLNEDFPC